MHFIILLHLPIILTKGSCCSIVCLHCSVLGKIVCFFNLFSFTTLSVLLITLVGIQTCLKLQPPVLRGDWFVRSLVFCVMFCRSLFVLFLLAIALSVLQFTVSGYLFGIFKLLFLKQLVVLLII